MSNEIWISPSQVTTKRRCFRLWGYQYILGFKTPSTPDQQFGIDGHAILQNYLGKGTPPPNDDLGRTALQGIERGFLPAPGPGLLLEHKIQVRMAQGFVLNGVIDLVNTRDRIWQVLDHKFVKSLKYAKEPADALTDPQSVIYCAVALSMHPAPEIDWSWVYYGAKGKERPRVPCGARKVTRRLTPADLEPGWLAVLADCKEMIAAKTAGTRPEALPHNPLACDEYSGCPFRDICPIDHGRRLGMMVAAASLPNTENILTPSATMFYNPGPSPVPAKEDTMGLLDDLRSGMPTPPPAAPPPQYPAGLPTPGTVNPPEGATRVAAPVAPPPQIAAQGALFAPVAAATPPPAPAAYIPPPKQPEPVAPPPPAAPSTPVTQWDNVPAASAAQPAAIRAAVPQTHVLPSGAVASTQPGPMGQVVLVPGTPMPASIPARGDQPLSGFIVLVDCLKAKGEQGTQLIDALKPICQWLEQQYQVGHWSAISYNTHGAPGSAFLARAFDDWISRTRPTGTMILDSTTMEARAVMEVLMARADVVIRGIR